jgi:hypothetical protein
MVSFSHCITRADLLAEPGTRAEDGVAARVAMLRAYAVRPDNASAERLAREARVARKSAAELAQVLEFLAMRGWKTRNMPGILFRNGLRWLVPRVLFAEKHKCGAFPSSLALAAVAVWHVRTRRHARAKARRAESLHWF